MSHILINHAWLRLLEFEKKCHWANIIYAFKHFRSSIKCRLSGSPQWEGKDLPMWNILPYITPLSQQTAVVGLLANLRDSGESDLATDHRGAIKQTSARPMRDCLQDWHIRGQSGLFRCKVERAACPQEFCKCSVT